LFASGDEFAFSAFLRGLRVSAVRSFPYPRGRRNTKKNNLRDRKIGAQKPDERGRMIEAEYPIVILIVVARKDYDYDYD